MSSQDKWALTATFTAAFGSHCQLVWLPSGSAWLAGLFAHNHFGLKLFWLKKHFCRHTSEFQVFVW